MLNRRKRHVWIKWIGSVTTILLAILWSFSRDREIYINLPPTTRVPVLDIVVASETVFVFVETTTPDSTAFDHLQKRLRERSGGLDSPLLEVRKPPPNLNYVGYPYRRFPELVQREYSYPCRNKWQCSLGAKCPLQGKAFFMSELSLPVWLPTAIFLIPTLWATWKDRKFIPPGHCRYCGYDLRGSASGVCSECGMPFPNFTPN